LISALSACAPDAARAEDLPPLVVTAASDLPAAGYGGQEALATFTVLEPAAHDLAEIFRRVPGLVSQEALGGFDPPRVAVRGSGIQSAPVSRGLAVSLFGMPLNAADGAFNLALLEGSWIESAALIRGPAAGVPALGGSLAFGGPGDVFEAESRAGFSIGSDESWSLSANGVHSAGAMDFAGRAAVNRTGGWRPHSAQRRESVYGAWRLDLTSDADLTIQFLAVRPWLEVPGPLTRDAAMREPESILPAVARDRPFRETEYAHLAARFSMRGAGGSMSVGLGGVSHRDEFRQLAANGISETVADEAYFLFNGTRDWEAAGQQTRFATILHAGWWDAERYRNAAGERGALIGRQRLRPLNLTTSIDHRVRIVDGQFLEIGGSLLIAERGIDDRHDHGPGGMPVEPEFSSTRFAPRAAWSWEPVEEFSLVASWARSYEPPTYNDLFFTSGPAWARVLDGAPLDWQRADSFECGVRGRHGGFAWSSHVYHAVWQAEFLRLVDETGSPRGTVNAGRTIHRGWETAAEWSHRDESGALAAMWANCNLTDARFDGDPVYGDRRLGGVPPFVGALGLRLVSPGGWFVAPEIHWRVGDTYGDHFNDTRYGGTGLCSLEVGRRHPHGWSVTIGIRNLFDRRAIASTTGVLDRAASPENAAIFLPAAGRTFVLGFEHTW
jgi:iron complex outermembrane recepter protein